ncbi:MAG: hypothetical protein KDI19_15300, partial [Pseudomonadales bacterium]|nr:hypothetical protein [Pseudomonadales bacterium]
VFSQFTYAEGDSGFAVDNTDLRYADATIVNGKSLQYGITLDNNPTVGDLWNSTPAWSYPYSSSDVAPEPGADSLVGSLGGAVAGLGAYGMLDGKYYGHVALYRNTSVNSAAGSTNVIDGVAPYWRLAWQKNIGTSYLMLGTYGLDAKVIPDAMTVAGGIGGPTARYLDTALDFQYERPVTGNTSLVAHGSFTRERRSDVDADGAYLAGSRETWKFSKVDVEYNMGRWRPGLAAFNTDTASDGLDSRGYLLSVGYFPWQNLELDLQYRGYTKFDGTSANAGDNDSVYLGLWLMI